MRKIATTKMNEPCRVFATIYKSILKGDTNMIVYVMGFTIIVLTAYIFILKRTNEAIIGYMLSKGVPIPKDGEMKEWIDWAIRNSIGNKVKPPIR